MINAAWQIEVDGAITNEWSHMLGEFVDANIYQTAAYGEVRWGEKNISRIVLKRGAEVMAMAQLRIIRPTPFKFGIAYLRWGPVWERRHMSVDPEVPILMARAIENEYLGKRRLFLRIIPNAFAGSERAAMMQASFHRFTAETAGQDNIYRTFVLDISPSLDNLRKRLDPKWRNKLSGAEKNELEVVAGSGSEEYRSFCEIYKQMRKRKGFETTVSVDEFGRIQESLAEPERMRILICRHKGIPVAGLVVSAMGDSAIYLLGATSDDGLKSKGAYLLHWTMIQWLKSKGIRWYDLGGIDPQGNPGVYLFKKGFSGVDICQINPLYGSDGAAYSGLMKTCLGVQRRFRALLKSVYPGRSLKQQTART